MVGKRVVLLSVVLCLFVSSPLFAITRSWTGTVSANWSDPANWSPSGIPTPADSLVFPKDPVTRTMNDDLPAGTSVGSMSVFDFYVLGGNALTLTGDLSVDGSAFNLGLTVNQNVTLAGPVQIGGIFFSYVRFTGDVDLNGQTLTLAGSTTYIHGTLSGTGSVTTSGGELQIAGGGSFSGTIQTQLTHFSGSLPNATITAGSLNATGTMGDLTSLGSLSIANESVGVLHTKSVQLKGPLNVDLYPPAADQLQAAGTVTLEGTLHLQIQSGAPALGQSYVIIDNDGTDSVIGTFAGLPEGAILPLQGFSFQISYAGGDGNDVVLTVVAPNKQWNGAVSGVWSDGLNWSPQGAPSPGQVLVFPRNPVNRTMNNDLPAGTSVGAMSFFDFYILGGNALTLTGDLSVNSAQFGLTVNSDVKLGGPVQVSRPDGGSTPVRFTGDLNLNGQTLTLAGNTTYIHGTLSGTGSIVRDGISGGELEIAGGGSFSGTIHAPLRRFSGSLPNATVTASSLDAVGTMGDLTILSPGGLTISGTSAGVLHTKSVGLKGGLSVDLYPSASSDQLKVTGTVTLEGSLFAQIPSGVPVPGQSYVIIDNDGTDPVIGTFAGLPEGATVIGSGYSLQISYAGGDGNDVVLTVALSNKTWTGAVSAAWSDGRNWSPQGVPSPGQVLVFPSGAANRTMNNDLPAGLSVAAMQSFDFYILGGNPLTLTGDLSVGGDAFDSGLTVNAGVKLGGSVRISRINGPSLAYVRFTGDLNLNGQPLTLAGSTTYIHGTLSGTGSITTSGGELQIAGGGSFSGPIQTSLRLFSGSLPNATVTAVALDAVGTMGDLTTLSPGFLSIAGTSAGVLHTKSVRLKGELGVDLYPSSSDQLQATGTVTLEGTLRLQLWSGLPAAGQSYEIIDNDGTDPVIGTFAGLPEGATRIQDGRLFQISYAGGDGNDVVLRVVEATATALSQSSNESVFGQSVTLTASVTSPAGTPSGTVFFTADGLSIGTAPLLNGVATVTVTTLRPGTDNIAAAFHGAGIFADSTSNLVSHVVTRGQTAITVVSDQQNSIYGATIRLTATVSPVAPAAGAATGSVTFLADGLAIGTGQLSGNTATLETPALHAGLRSITAAYGGDSNFNSSISSPIQLNVSKAQTEIDARSRVAVVGESPLITVFVNILPGSPLAPTGVVTISEGGTSLGTQLLAGGAASFSLRPLAMGDHTLVVNYSGDTDCEASSETIVQRVVAPGLSIHGTRVSEGNRGVTAVTLVVSLSAPVTETVRVSFSTVGGSAAEGEDYEKASGVIEFAPGELTRSIELHILGDTFAEGDETFSVMLSNAVNATIDTPSAVVVIANDDQVPPRHRPSRH